jgi:hypothetical protein
MWGDELARQWFIIRATEDSSNGLPLGEIARREETVIRTIYCFLKSLQRKCHAKTQRTQREIFRLLLSFLDIFFTPSQSFKKTIKRFPAKNPLRSLRLGVRRFGMPGRQPRHGPEGLARSAKCWKG